MPQIPLVIFLGKELTIPRRLITWCLASLRFDMLVIPGVRNGYGDRSAYFNWIRSDYFCRHLLGQYADSVDIVELNKEKEQTGDKKRR